MMGVIMEKFFPLKIFPSKHMLWVSVRITFLRRFYSVVLYDSTEKFEKYVNWRCEDLKCIQNWQLDIVEYEF